MSKAAGKQQRKTHSSWAGRRYLSCPPAFIEVLWIELISSVKKSRKLGNWESETLDDTKKPTPKLRQNQEEELCFYFCMIRYIILLSAGQHSTSFLLIFKCLSILLGILMNFGPGQGNLSSVLNLSVQKNAMETVEPKGDPETAGAVLAVTGSTTTERPLRDAMKLPLESEEVYFMLIILY